jgi:transcription initiation factor TFIIIB Brf1 subunit/transcription initiation factor TFIIB
MNSKEKLKSTQIIGDKIHSRSIPIQKSLNTSIISRKKKTSKSHESHRERNDSLHTTETFTDTRSNFRVPCPVDNRDVYDCRIENNDDIDLLFSLAHQQIENKEIKKQTICSHVDTINENGIELCVDCGEALHSKLLTTQEWRFYGANDNQHSSDPNRCQMRKVQDKGIKKDLEKLGLTTQVIDIADDLYFKVTKGDIKRNNLRKGIMFACVFEAYKKIDTPQIPEHLQKLFNITRKNMSKGINYFRLGMPKDDISDIKYITAEHFIPKILDKFNIKSDHLQPILNLYKLLESKSSVINRRNPQSISCGLVYYYLKRLNVDIHPSKFGKVVDLSEITITNIVTEIEDILYLS